MRPLLRIAGIGGARSHLRRAGTQVLMQIKTQCRAVFSSPVTGAEAGGA
jgi:hypothetical protein